MKILSVLILLFAGCAVLTAQYPVSGTVFIRDGKSSQINLLVIHQDKKIKVPVDINGVFNTILDWNEEYQLCFSKRGYISKKIDFNTHIPESFPKDHLYPYQLLVELFPLFPNADTVFFRNPVAKIHFSNHAYDFDFDMDYQLVIKNKIDALKKDYAQWIKEGSTKPRPPKEVVSKKQKAAALDYQKGVEVAKNTKEVIAKTTMPNQINKIAVKKDPFGLPPIEKTYPEGKSIEVFELKGKVITRVVMKNGGYQKVFYRVKHDWGGLYFFVQEAPTYYRSISKYNFDKATQILEYSKNK